MSTEQQQIESKKEYEAPVLLLLGKLSELTQGTTGSVVENGPTPNHPGKP